MLHDGVIYQKVHFLVKRTEIQRFAAVWSEWGDRNFEYRLSDKKGRKRMPQSTICRTVRQHNSRPVSGEDMRKLQEIASDYCKVKNYVYGRYGSIASLPKLYPGYTIQNEMTRSGLRDSMEMPSVYFYLAVFDALGDIKSQWTRTRAKILELVGKNGHFSGEERHYLCFLLKVNNAFEAVLNQQQAVLPRDIRKRYEELSARVDTERLNRYLCRQVRKYHVRLHTDQAEGFSLTERAYRYGDHGIYISIKEKRRRVFIPLTDSNRYKRQLYLKLYPEKECVEIHVPVDVMVREHEDYVHRIGAAMGYHIMLTTDSGNGYGTELGKYQTEYADWIRVQTAQYSRNRSSNPGRKKYHDKKRRMTERMHSYINHELNRFLETEKPRTVYIMKPPVSQGRGVNRRINHSIAMWQRGYIRSRLLQKCREQSVELVEVLGKGVSSECSECGAAGKKENGFFFCPACGCQKAEKANTAKNILKRGLEGRVVRQEMLSPKNRDRTGFRS